MGAGRLTRGVVGALPGRGIRAIAVTVAILGIGAAVANAGGPSRSGSSKMAALIEQGSKLGGANEVGHGAFGYAVALSGDGSTAIVGAPQDKNSIGAVWVFVRSGETWVPQGGKITATGELGHGFFGVSVALSEDGNTALVGSPKDGKGDGAAYVFTRTGETWTQRARLTGGEEVEHANFGRRVALSSDGQTALMGGYADDNNAGAAWVFVRSGESWTQQGPKLTGAGETGAAQFGGDVSLSGDGNTALIGGPADNGSLGAIWFFARSGDEWSSPDGKLTATGEVGAAEFGRSVSLSDAGGSALIGGPTDSSDLGAAWVFTFDGEGWGQSAELAVAATKGHPDFGRDVALSGDGKTALIGAPKAHVGAGGAAYVFNLQGGAWTPQGAPLTGATETKHGDFARSVALSDDGATALIGGPKDHHVGAAFTYGE